MKRAQFVLEFAIFLAIAIFVGIAYLAVSSSIFADVSEQQRVAALNDIGYMVQDELILAETVEDGYARNFTIPAKADRFPYELSMNSTVLTLSSGRAVLSYDLPALNGSLQKGVNTVRKDGGLRVMPG